MRKVNSSNKIVSGMLWRFGEKITAQLVSFVVSIVLARLLMPDDYGIVAIVNVFIVIVEVFVTSGLGTALIQKINADETDFSTLFWSNLVFSLLLYCIMFFLSPVVATLYNMPKLTTMLRVFSLRLPISAVNSIQNAYVSRRMEFKKFFFATIIGTIISAAVGIIMAYQGFGAWALIAQYLTNSVIDTIVLFLTIKWKPKLIFSFRRAKPLVSYGWKILATDLIGVIFNQLNALIVGKKYKSSDLAYYTQGKKIPDLINNNIGGTLNAVLFPAMSQVTEKEEIIKIRRQSLKLLGYVLFPIMIGLIAVADNLVEVLLTDKWLLAVPYLRITCIAAIISVFGTTLIQEVKAIGRSDVTLRMELIKKPVYLSIALIAMQFGVKAIALTLILDEIIALGCNVYPVKKYIGFNFKVHLFDTLPSFIMALIMGGVVYILDKRMDNGLVSLVIQVLTGVITYIGLSYVTRNESFLYLRNMLLSKIKKV